MDNKEKEKKELNPGELEPAAGGASISRPPYIIGGSLLSARKSGLYKCPNCGTLFAQEQLQNRCNDPECTCKERVFVRFEGGPDGIYQ